MYSQFMMHGQRNIKWDGVWQKHFLIYWSAFNQECNKCGVARCKDVKTRHEECFVLWRVRPAIPLRRNWVSPRKASVRVSCKMQTVHWIRTEQILGLLFQWASV